MSHPERILYLSSGLESSGCRAVSRSFLQRPDMFGVLDAENDLLPSITPHPGLQSAWYGTTFGAFRLSELVRHYRDDGWVVRPLLVVRDARHVWAAMLQDASARNGLTAEDPPLRMRLRRFLDDWELFYWMRWPMVRFEDLLRDSHGALEAACELLGLPWDDAMLARPGAAGTLKASPMRASLSPSGLRTDLQETLLLMEAQADPSLVHGEDLAWLEREFQAFNVENGYPEHMEAVDLYGDLPSGDRPGFAVTRRYAWESRQDPLGWLLARLGLRNQKLIEARSVKRVA